MLKAKFYYAIVGSKLVQSWSQRGSKPNSITLLVRSLFEAGWRPASNQLRSR